MKMLILGSKEYPMGSNKGDDSISSGGMEVYTEEIVKALSKKKIQCIIISRSFANSLNYEKNDNLEVYRVRWFKGFFLRNISFNFFAFMKARKLQFDIILTNGVFATFFANILKKFKHKKVIARPAGIATGQPQYNFIVNFLLKRIETSAYKKADYVIFLSQQEKEQFSKKLNFLPKRYEIIPTGIDLKAYEKTSSSRIKKEFSIRKEHVVTFIGRLIEVKGLSYLIDSFLNIKNSKLLIVGDGPLKNKLREQADLLGLKNVVFAGQRHDIKDILKATDIFVLPSVSEGLPVALLEAMASGCACIVTDIGLPVTNQKNALVIPAKDTYELEKAMNLLIKNKKLRMKLRREAKLHIKNNFNWDNAVKKYLKIVDELVK